MMTVITLTICLKDRKKEVGMYHKSGCEPESLGFLIFEKSFSKCSALLFIYPILFVFACSHFDNVSD